MTLGTIFNTESGDLFSIVIAGLRHPPVQVVVTVGLGIDLAELGPQLCSAYVVRYLLQALLLPQCTAVLNHAGSGSVLGTLEHGLPMVFIPMGADQLLNRRVDGSEFPLDRAAVDCQSLRAPTRKPWPVTANPQSRPTGASTGRWAEPV